MTLFLLCDMRCCTASFGKISIKNLNKLKKLDISGDDFSIASGLKPPADYNKSMQIHDQITHRVIPKSISKYINPSTKPEYKQTSKYLPLNPQNLTNTTVRNDFNEGIEQIADAVEGKRYYKGSSLDQIGKALRKKNLSKVEKIATNQRDSFTVDDLIKTKRKATQDDVNRLIANIKKTPSVVYNKKERLARKQRGAKPQPQATTIEQKKQGLKQKYGIL